MTAEELKAIEKLTEAVKTLDETLSGFAWIKLAEVTEGSDLKLMKFRDALKNSAGLWTQITELLKQP